MDPVRNPFAPGAGTQPPELKGRQSNLERANVVLERVKSGRSDRSMLMVGLRGVGKTVLLNRIQRLAEGKGFETVTIETPEGENLAQVLTPFLRQAVLRLDFKEGVKDKFRKAIGVLRSFASTFQITIGDVGLGVNPAPGTADSGVLDKDFTDVAVAIGEAAAEASTPLALFVDELQYIKEKELGALIAGFHRVAQLNLPFIIIGAGLPQLAGKTGRAKSYAERLFEFQEIGALAAEDSRTAIKEPIARAGMMIDDDALELIVKETEGYPYFLQEWGLHAWNRAPASPISLADVVGAGEAATKALDQSFFRVRFDRLTRGEQLYLRAMAELGPGPHRSGDIATRMGKESEQVAPMRANIISKGMIFSPKYGENAFTVPKFNEYMRRAMPEFPPKSRR